jgi:hypothetical protein
MIIIGVDFHPEFQQIASVDTDSGEFQENQSLPLVRTGSSDRLVLAAEEWNRRARRGRWRRYGVDANPLPGNSLGIYRVRKARPKRHIMLLRHIRYGRRRR